LNPAKSIEHDAFTVPFIEFQPMSGLADPDLLLRSRGTQQNLDAFVVAAAFDGAGRQAAFALGDGRVMLASPAEPWQTVAAHEGAVLALAADCTPSGFVSGGDDGALRRIGPDGATGDIARFGMKWVEHVASHPGGRGVLACAVGKRAHLYDAAGAPLKTLEHPSSVAGLAFDARGKRVAAAHYNGASLWFVAAGTP
jgi:hypothetical protein